MPVLVTVSAEYSLRHSVLQKQRADTCVVHREESLLHKYMLQVLIIHRDLSHHVAWHITRETTGLPMIETIRVFVSKHLTNADTGSFETISDFERKKNARLFICTFQQLSGSVKRRQIRPIS